MSEVEGDMYYVSQGKNKKLQLRGECISELDSNQLSWKFIETVSGRYNGTYYVVWNAFVGGSKNMVGSHPGEDEGRGRTYLPRPSYIVPRN